MSFAARLTDFHQCPMQNPTVPPIPHVGGPVVGPGAPTVLIGSLPGAVMGCGQQYAGPIPACHVWNVNRPGSG